MGYWGVLGCWEGKWGRDAATARLGDAGGGMRGAAGTGMQGDVGTGIPGMLAPHCLHRGHWDTEAELKHRGERDKKTTLMSRTKRGMFPWRSPSAFPGDLGILL